MIVLNIIGHFASEFDSILFQNHIYIYIYCKVYPKNEK